jgi:hypothetical protein
MVLLFGSEKLKLNRIYARPLDSGMRSAECGVRSAECQGM